MNIIREKILAQLASGRKLHKRNNKKYFHNLQTKNKTKL